MKRPIFLCIGALCLTSIAGCQSSSAPNTAPGNFDPVATIGASRYENDQKFDVGIGFFRCQDQDGMPSLFPGSDIEMAFSSNGNPAQVSSAIVNRVPLPWISPGSQSGYQENIYHKIDSLAYGNPDSMSFSYQDFAGESFTSTADIAPSFGKITFPDTCSAAFGCNFSYEHPVPGDSIKVVISFQGPPDVIPSILWTIPDTGGFTILPHQLSSVPYAPLNYTVAIYRYHWSTVTSPNGKRIGIYSEQDAIFDFFVNP
jgi:hypothetical protein